ncbi:hypothetical protein JHK82_043126 [Glycine max]|uniref:No apical meristem-associated C-terminal domain-containing protein n=1 Tax=Glycine max TaxID=3847 RepID=A0A0R0GFI3_SOYBN|nr:hypothetical protein JHK86_043160 [Glycine max]KAG4957419.1 hypothetical protein JHK85_043799 [Glycine max]KAG5106156.1 hypothetical protein JHK82_043126 [Glycine max]KAG5117237.1 hypothetical protein JHK84_043350 [Glycine max]KAH1148218.1 hypothetical protein GYH30_043059 [Glycine max]
MVLRWWWCPEEKNRKRIGEVKRSMGVAEKREKRGVGVETYQGNPCGVYPDLSSFTGSGVIQISVTCIKRSSLPSLSNIESPSNEIESPIGVDSIQLDERDQNSDGKKVDSITGVDQTSNQYWARIKNAYNNDDVRQSGQFCEKRWTQLKSRRSGSFEKNVLADAHMIYRQDSGKKFEVEQAWLLLKDQPKFDAKFMSKYSKRTKVSISGNYSSSSNPETPIEVKEYDTSSPILTQLDKKQQKGRAKEMNLRTLSIYLT